VHTSREMFREGRRAGMLSACLHASFAFVKGYILRAGFLDGAAGILVANYNMTLVFYKYAALAELCADQKRNGGF